MWARRASPAPSIEGTGRLLKSERPYSHAGTKRAIDRSRYGDSHRERDSPLRGYHARPRPLVRKPRRNDLGISEWLPDRTIVRCVKQKEKPWWQGIVAPASS